MLEEPILMEQLNFIFNFFIRPSGTCDIMTTERGQNMIYLLFGTQSLILDKQLKKILKENLTEIDDFHLQKFIATETPIQDIISEVELSSLLGDKKAIVVYKPYFLSQEKNKEKIESIQDYKVLESYLDNPSNYNDLVFVLESAKLNEKSPFVKKLLKVARVIEAKEITKDEWPLYIATYFKKANIIIDDEAIQELSLRVQGDALRFTNEAKKLMLYTEHITLEDIELMVSRPLEENAFAIFDNLIKKQNDKAIAIYRDLLVANEEPIRLISLISNQLRLLLEVEYLRNKIPSYRDIASELGIHEYRVKLALGHLKQISRKKIIKKLDELYNLDLNIKSGKVNNFFSFEMFLIKF